MKKYRFSYRIEYEVEGEDEQDAVNALADLLKRDWPEYLNEGELIEVKEE